MLVTITGASFMKRQRRKIEQLAKRIYKRKRKMNKKMKMTFVEMYNLVKLAKELGVEDVESYIDSSLGYYENRAIIEKIAHNGDTGEFS